MQNIMHTARLYYTLYTVHVHVVCVYIEKA